MQTQNRRHIFAACANAFEADIFCLRKCIRSRSLEQEEVFHYKSSISKAFEIKNACILRCFLLHPGSFLATFLASWCASHQDLSSEYMSAVKRMLRRPSLQGLAPVMETSLSMLLLQPSAMRNKADCSRGVSLLACFRMRVAHQ